MRITREVVAAVAIAGAALAGTPAAARDHILVVGSSTVFPFTAAVIQRVSTTAGIKVVNKSTGTGGGFHAFCAGLGDAHPDVTGASRAITDAEKARCNANGVDDLVEIIFGRDGITVVNAVHGPKVGFSRRQLFRALAKESVKDGQVVANPYQTWKEIDPALPDLAIKVMGPPGTSGTRDAFNDLAMVEGCGAEAAVQALPPERRKAVCTTMREDGAYIEMGEDDEQIINRLRGDTVAFGILGFSYAFKNSNIVKTVAIEGVVPDEETIADGRYPLSRPLFLYVKPQHATVAPGLVTLVSEYTREQAIGPDGYLVLDFGLVPLDADGRVQARAAASRIGPVVR